MKVKKTIIEKRDISVVIPTEIIAEAKKFGRYGGHVIVPNKWVGKTVKMILMTAVMLSLFTSAAILAQNLNTNIAFAKKATTTTSSDTGTKTKATKTDTVVKNTPKETSSSSDNSNPTSSTTTTSPSITSNTNGKGGGSGGKHGVGDVTTTEPVTGSPGPASQQQQQQQQQQTGNTLPNGHNIEQCQSQGGVAVVKAKCKPNTVQTGPSPLPVTPTINTIHCPKGTHNVITLGCIKNHLTQKEAFGLGCKMGFNDNPDQEAYIATGGFRHHSTTFTQGYNLAFGNGKDPSACKPYKN
jgi:hypothetical protein